MNLFVRTIWF